MWYRSKITNKIIRDCPYGVNNIFGANTFNRLIDEGILIPENNLSVIDILQETGSVVQGAVRYREIHGIGLREAKEAVEQIKQDMDKFKSKERTKKRWKKRTAAKPANTENALDTGK